MQISLVIPAYNEEKTIKASLKRYHELFEKKFKKDYEIIVVVNNCKDNTLKAVIDFNNKNKYNLTKIINIPGYVGKGGAVMRGFSIAKGDYIGFVDADRSTNPENFFKLYENRKNFDGIIASRRIKGAVIYPRRSLNKELSSFLFNKITNLLFNLNFKDTQCGAKLFKKDTIEFLLKHYTQKNWIFDVELLLLCKKNNLKILEYPIFWTDGEDSKLTFNDQVLSMWDLFKYRLKTK